MATRTHFHRSRFITLLAELVAIDGGGALDAFAEKLGQWILIAEAIGLRASHNAPAMQARDEATVPNRLAALEHAFASTRNAVEEALAAGIQTAAGPRKATMPWPQRNTPLEMAGAYEPFRRYYVANQRDMDLKVKPMRMRLRETAANASPALRQLAGIDAAMDTILAEREAMLLAKVPALLEKRFKQLRHSHQDALAFANIADHIDLWLKPGGWMMRFGHEMQAVLLAEWDLRLQPALGLLEALHNEKAKPI